jgi:hypothetical protein
MLGRDRKATPTIRLDSRLPGEASDRTLLKLEYLSLAEIFQSPELLEPPTPLIPYLAYEGRVTLLAAAPKAGKSTILSQAVSAYSTGEPFLGQPVGDAGLTLWYTIDEPLADTARRFAAFNAKPDVIVVCALPPSAKEMSSAVREYDARVVVVDVLGELMAAANLENDRDALPMAAFLRPYVDVARASGAALVLLHHTNKAGEYRGTTQLGGSVDGILTLRSRSFAHDAIPDVETDSEDGMRTLEGRTRWGRVFQRLSFDGVRYGVKDAPLPLNVRALRAYSEGHATSATQLSQSLGVRKGEALKVTQKLVEQDCLKRDGKRVVITATGAALLTAGPVPHKGSANECRPHPETNVRPLQICGTAGNRVGTDTEPAQEPTPHKTVPGNGMVQKPGTVSIERAAL